MSNSQAVKLEPIAGACNQVGRTIALVSAVVGRRKIVQADIHANEGGKACGGTEQDWPVIGQPAR